MQNPCHFLSLGNSLVLQESATLGIDAKCVMRLQTIISKILHYVVIFISSHLSPARLNLSSTSKPLATPLNRKILSLPSFWGLP